MSKTNKVLAGLGVCAGLGIALAPLSAFADSTAIDMLQVTIDDSITFGLDIDGQGFDENDGDVYPLTRTPGTGVSLGNGQEHSLNGTYSKTMRQGEVIDTFGTTELHVFSSKAYTITAAGNSEIGTSTPLPMTTSYGTTTTGWAYKPTLSEGLTAGANITVGSMNAPADSTAFTLATKTSASANTGDTVTVVYGVGVSTIQPAGTYVGSMKYTVAATQP